jgi:hypothetical protein
MLTPNKWVQWLELVERLMDIQLSNDKDSFAWNLTTFGGFTVKSMHLDLLDDQTKYLQIYLENKCSIEDQDFYVVPSA